MKILLAVSYLCLLGSFILSPVSVLEAGESDDAYEREADAVADKVLRPSPVMRTGVNSSAPIRGSGMETRAINGDECNPLCGMQGIGEASSQPAQGANARQVGNQAR
ncbi:MAG: hypothetical protein OQL19_04560 [Gammaproteobacteria bacterium]|nr:hypothetical protein [Gammaproteobacteria bacterium]